MTNYLMAKDRSSLCTTREEKRRTLTGVRATNGVFWVLRPDKCPNLNTLGLSVVYDTFLEFFRQGIGPLESGFLELRLVGLLGVVSGTPDDAGHLGNFVDTTGKTNGDYLLDGPGVPGP